MANESKATPIVDLRDQVLAIEQVRKLMIERIEFEQDAKRWQWARDILSGNDTPEANAKTLELAAGLMRNESVEQTIDNAIAALALATRT